MSYLTIYFNDKPVFLSDVINPEFEKLRHQPDTIFIDDFTTATVDSLLHEINSPGFNAGIILSKDLEKLKAQFFNRFNLIKAAGGLIKNKNDEILLIFRRGKWDLPKGKLDEGETIEQCAKREVEEETGLKNVEIVQDLGITYHTYVLFGKHNLKECHWYEMRASGNEQIIPQTEEDITKILWVKKEYLGNYFLNSFPTIISILKQA
ncbi:MAG: NUDIX domain-containing protein [Ginsengibacter sp.]